MGDQGLDRLVGALGPRPGRRRCLLRRLGAGRGPRPPRRRRRLRPSPSSSPESSPRLALDLAEGLGRDAVADRGLGRRRLGHERGLGRLDRGGPALAVTVGQLGVAVGRRAPRSGRARDPGPCGPRPGACPPSPSCCAAAGAVVGAATAGLRPPSSSVAVRGALAVAGAAVAGAASAAGRRRAAAAGPAVAARGVGAGPVPRRAAAPPEPSARRSRRRPRRRTRRRRRRRRRPGRRACCACAAARAAPAALAGGVARTPPSPPAGAGVGAVPESPLGVGAGVAAGRAVRTIRRTAVRAVGGPSAWSPTRPWSRESTRPRTAGPWIPQATGFGASGPETSVSDMGGEFPSHDARASACGGGVAAGPRSTTSRRAPPACVHWWMRVTRATTQVGVDRRDELDRAAARGAGWPGRPPARCPGRIGEAPAVRRPGDGAEHRRSRMAGRTSSVTLLALALAGDGELGGRQRPRARRLRRRAGSMSATSMCQVQLVTACWSESAPAGSATVPPAPRCRRGGPGRAARAAARRVESAGASRSTTSRYSASDSCPVDRARPKLSLGRGEKPSV